MKQHSSSCFWGIFHTLQVEKKQIIKGLRPHNIQISHAYKIYFFAEKGRWKSAFGASVLPLGHHREGLLWVAIYRSLQCRTLAGPHKASQKTGQK